MQKIFRQSTSPNLKLCFIEMAHRRTYIGTLTLCTAQQFRGKDTFRTKNCPCLVPNEEKKTTHWTYISPKISFHWWCLPALFKLWRWFSPQFSSQRYYLVKLITHWMIYLDLDSSWLSLINLKNSIRLEIGIVFWFLEKDPPSNNIHTSNNTRNSNNFT